MEAFCDCLAKISQIAGCPGDERRSMADDVDQACFTLGGLLLLQLLFWCAAADGNIRFAIRLTYVPGKWSASGSLRRLCVRRRGLTRNDSDSRMPVPPLAGSFAPLSYTIRLSPPRLGRSLLSKCSRPFTLFAWFLARTPMLALFSLFRLEFIGTHARRRVRVYVYVCAFAHDAGGRQKEEKPRKSEREERARGEKERGKRTRTLSDDARERSSSSVCSRAAVVVDYSTGFDLLRLAWRLCAYVYIYILFTLNVGTNARTAKEPARENRRARGLADSATRSQPSSARATKCYTR